MDAAASTSQSLALGVPQVTRILGRYELLLPIASGGMATVWAARLRGSRGFQKIVAVKTILPKLIEDPEFEQMFLDEASLASQIRHPHVVEILDLGEQEGVLYLVMEWIDGLALNEVMREARKHGGVPLPVAVRIGMQACAGLHAAHELKNSKGELVGLVHRDVSPQNILVTYDGVTKVADFGIAKATALGGGATASGRVKGKVGYMAPEQAANAPIDRRVDIFAIGIFLYALTTGRHPFRGESESDTLARICSQKPAMPPSQLVPGYPAALERVLLQALAKDPAKRLPTANDLLRGLDHALPASMRASTDEDVAAFVRGIFSERREQSRRALAVALDQASARTSAASAPSHPLSLDNESGPASVGTLGAQVISLPARRKLVFAAAAAAATLLGAVATLIALRSNDNTDLEPAAASTPTEAVSVGTQRRAAPARAPSAPPPAASAPVPSIPATTGVKSASASPSAPSRPPPAPKPLKPKSWRHDPGF